MDFKKPRGNLLSGSERWVRENLPVCPLCKRVPEWESATEFILAVRRYYYRCTNCLAVFSVLASEAIPVPGFVTTVINPIAFLVRIESTGKRESLAHLTGTEHSLTQLQEWAREGNPS
jgi:hypothetical protein